MRRNLVCILLFLSLTACSNVATPTDENSFSTSSGRCANGICVRIFAEEPILLGEPVNLIVKVTSKENVSDLEIVVSSNESTNDPVQKVFFEDTGTQAMKESDIKWTADVPANQELVFTRKAILPAEEGIYLFHLVVIKQPEVMVLEDALRIYLKKDGGQVIYQGTPMPRFTSAPLELHLTTMPNESSIITSTPIP